MSVTMDSASTFNGALEKSQNDLRADDPTKPFDILLNCRDIKHYNVCPEKN